MMVVPTTGGLKAQFLMIISKAHGDRADVYRGAPLLNLGQLKAYSSTIINKAHGDRADVYQRTLVLTPGRQTPRPWIILVPESGHPNPTSLRVASPPVVPSFLSVLPTWESKMAAEVTSVPIPRCLQCTTSLCARRQPPSLGTSLFLFLLGEV